MNKQIDSNLNPKKLLNHADYNSQKSSEIEAEYFSEEKLDQEAKKNEHKRTQGSKATIYWSNRVFIIAIYAITLIGVLIFSYHLFVPMECQFLGQEQRMQAQRLMKKQRT